MEDIKTKYSRPKSKRGNRKNQILKRKKSKSKKRGINNLSLDHVHYRSSNFKGTRKFYVDIMEGIELPNENLGGNENLHIALGGVSLLFALSGKPVPKPVPASERLGAYHIAFLVENCINATAYYKSRGAKVAIAPKRYATNILASFLTAPDGMLIELKEIIIRKKKKKSLL